MAEITGTMEWMLFLFGVVFSSSVDCGYVLKPQHFNYLIQEIYPFVQGIQKGNLQLRKGNFQWNSRESGAGSNVNDRFSCKLILVKITYLYNRKAVQEMLQNYFLILGNCSQIHHLIFLHKVLMIGDKLLFLVLGKGNSKLFKAFLKES